jgi:mannosyl-oligosaccharide alpha-1,2-mannosidase
MRFLLFMFWNVLPLCVICTGLAVSRPEIRSEVPVGARNNVQREAVREAFVHAWTGYKKYAFPNDDLHPVDNGHGNSRNGWGGSAVDAFSTALIMGEKDIINSILNFIPMIDFSYTTRDVSLFETTIRYMGGMLVSIRPPKWTKGRIQLKQDCNSSTFDPDEEDCRLDEVRF